jgi:RNA polymerase sigma factor (sigma-70 family)
VNLTRDQEAALIAHVAQGDEQAFEKLRGAFKSLVDGFLRARANNDEDARDIAQETWLKVWKSAQNYDPSRGGWSTFLRTIANSTLLDYYRKNYRPIEILFSDLQHQFSDAGDPPEIGDLLARLTPAAIRQTPEGTLALLEDLALRLVFEGSSPPHQMIAFGFIERLGWKPQAIVEELSLHPLKQVEKTLEDEYLSTSRLSASVVRTRFQKLRECMSRRLDDVVKEIRTREVCREFLESVVGETLLRQYYTHEPAQEISHWCQAVRRRIVKENAAPIKSGSTPNSNREPACDNPVVAS